jgi:hypothetical protein
MKTLDLSTLSSSKISQLLEYFILISSSLSEQSIKSKIRSAASDSSKVDLNASIIYVGSLLINPTVSVSKTTKPSSLIFSDRVVVERVVNKLPDIPSAHG